MISKLYIIACSLIILLLSGCGIQKRRYTTGYYLENTGNKPRPTIKSFYPTYTVQNQTAIVANIHFPANHYIEKNIFCDTLLLKNKRVVACRIVEENSFSVKVKNCGGAGSIITEIPKKEILSIIKDPNPEKEIRETASDTTRVISPTKQLQRSKEKRTEKINSIRRSGFILTFLSVILFAFAFILLIDILLLLGFIFLGASFITFFIGMWGSNKRKALWGLITDILLGALILEILFALAGGLIS